MNGKTEASIVLQCQGERQMMVMYQDTGITIACGRRDPERMLIVETQEEIKFAEHPELVGLYFDHAWDVASLMALVIKARLEGSRA